MGKQVEYAKSELLRHLRDAVPDASWVVDAIDDLIMAHIDEISASQAKPGEKL